MKYESENLRISDQDEDLDPKLDEQIARIKSQIADIFTEEQVRHDVALSVLATMYVVTCHRIIEMPKEIALEAIRGAIEMQYAEDDEQPDDAEMHFANMEKPKWLN
jgi:hypothetical protein